MEIKLSDHFTYKRLFRFVIPSVVMMIFTSIYGVAAYGVIMYINFIFVAVFIGYSIGSAPIIGYNYGAGNNMEMKSVFKNTIVPNGGSARFTAHF